MSDLTRAEIEKIRRNAIATPHWPCEERDLIPLCDLALRLMDQLAVESEHIIGKVNEIADKTDEREKRIAAAIAHCRNHEHSGVSPGYHAACANVRRILEGER